MNNHRTTQSPFAQAHTDLATLVPVDKGHAHNLKVLAETASLPNRAIPRHGAHFAVSDVGLVEVEVDGHAGLVNDEWRVNHGNGNVVDGLATIGAAVFFVLHDLDYFVKGATSVGVVRTGADLAIFKVGGAVTGGDDEVVVDDATTAEVAASPQKGHLMGDILDGDGVTTNDSAVLVWVYQEWGPRN